MATITEELERMAGLLDRGLITREEFDQHKRRLMTASVMGSTGRPSSVGSYRVLGDIGQGGMGRVYRGRHRVESFAERQGGDVAIKVLHAQYAERSDILERFEREAELGIRLEHPGIVRVFELVSDAGRVALIMELVEGRPLSEMIGSETGPIPWPRAEALVNQLLAAVEYAHAQGVIHRDLKPENVMVSAAGHLKILDFGIAKDISTGRTQTGTGMGTVDYMAPEQYIDAKTVDARADIYALGMTLYEMLAGRLPWSGDLSEFILLEAKRDGKIVPPTEFYPDIPPGIVAAVMQCLRPDKAERPADIGALRGLLDRKREPAARVPSPTPGPTAPAPSLPRTGVERVAFSLGKATAAVVKKNKQVPSVSRSSRLVPEPIEFEASANIHYRLKWQGHLQLTPIELRFVPTANSIRAEINPVSMPVNQIMQVKLSWFLERLSIVLSSGESFVFSGKAVWPVHELLRDCFSIPEISRALRPVRAASSMLMFVACVVAFGIALGLVLAMVS